MVNTPIHLSNLLRESALRFPEKTALIEPEKPPLTYGELNDLVKFVKGQLEALGVQKGDRVVICLPKGYSAVAALFATMDLGATYVPVDYLAPPVRNAFVIQNCKAKVVLCDPDVLPAMETQLNCPFSNHPVSSLNLFLCQPAWQDQLVLETKSPPAYILYTSGSTGYPKGVMISHKAAFAFIDWAGNTFNIESSDVFSSIAPFHFDLSIFDLYTSIQHGASIVLINQKVAKNPYYVTSLIDTHKISVLYTTPTLLKLFLRYGKLERHQHDSLRLVLFAGEVFPIPSLRQLMGHWPIPTYYNLYGPTETNVCTFFKIPSPVPASQTTPFPIGEPCSFAKCAIWRNDQLFPVQSGEEGELLVAGESLLSAYLNLPERTKEAFYHQPEETWYKTGDLVRVDDKGLIVFVDRIGRMVKRNGYRIELGEIEHGLLQHEKILETAAVRSDQPEGPEIVAFYISRNNETIPFADLKVFLSSQIPVYMSPDRIIQKLEFPKTSSHKTDYQSLIKSISDR